MFVFAPRPSIASAIACCCAALALAPVPAAATDYYFSSASGNDAWSGTLASPNASGTNGPKQTLVAAEALLQKVVAPGDRVLFRRGEVWTRANFGLMLDSTAGTPEQPIVVGAYGTGPNPRLDIVGEGAVLVVRGSDRTPSSHLRFEGLKFSTSAAEGNQPRGIWMDESLNPNRPHHVTFQGLEIEGLLTGVSILRMSDVTVENCVIRNNHSMGMFAQGQNITIRGNLFENNGKPDSDRDWNAYLAEGDGYLFENNVLRRPVGGLKLRRANNAVVRGNVFHDMDLVGITVGGDSTGGIQNVVIERNLFYDTVDGITIKDQSEQGTPGVTNLIVRNNILHDNKRDSVNFKGGYPGYITLMDDPVRDVLIYNNLIYGVVRKAGILVFNPTPMNLQIKNNILHRADAEAPLVELLSGMPTGFVLDANLYHCAGSCSVAQVGNTPYPSLAAFKSAYPAMELRGRQGDPLLDNPPEDFHLTSSSTLAIDQGVDAPGIVDADFEGQPRPVNRWDIGPFELRATPGNPPAAPVLLEP